MFSQMAGIGPWLEISKTHFNILQIWALEKLQGLTAVEMVYIFGCSLLFYKKGFIENGVA
jgi:hypothetical protein